MAQHDYDLINQSGASFRADLNNALDAIASNNSGSSEPSTTFAYEWWVDTTNNLLKLRNSANNAWITLPLSITADNSTSGALTVNGNLSTTGTLDVNGGEVILDSDADTSITADTDDQIDFRIGGTDVATLTNSHLVLKGTTPKITIGDGGEEDTALIFDGNAQDFYIGLDDSADDLIIGKGSTIGTTPAITIDSDLKVGLNGLSAGDYWSSSNQLVLGNTTSAANGGLTIATANDATGQIYFADGTTGDARYRGQIQYTHVSDAMDFQTAASFAMRINSSGALLIGKSADNLTDSGFTLKKRVGSDHAQLTCVGTGSSSVETYYIYDSSNSEYEFFVSYAGAVHYRSLVSLSDERKKDNIQNITLGLDAIKELRPVSFDWKNDKGNDQLGFIAQEVETTSLKKLVSTYKDENIEDCKSLNKEQMIPVLVKAIQELEARVQTLEG
jgi:hypothetical protein